MDSNRGEEERIRMETEDKTKAQEKNQIDGARMQNGKKQM